MGAGVQDVREMLPLSLASQKNGVVLADFNAFRIYSQMRV